VKLGRDLTVAALLFAGVGLAWSQPDSTGALPDTAETTDITASVALAAPGEVVPAITRPFKPGEYLRFSVQYGVIKAGSAYLEVHDGKQIDGQPSVTLVARAESNSFFSAFYKVRTRIESVWNPDGRYSVRYQERRREGKNKYESDIVFDHDRLEARYRDGQAFPIPPQVQDALSSFYYTRFQALPLGGSIVFDYHASRKTKPLEVKVLGRERIETPAGKFDCIAIEPILLAGGIFKNKGQLVIWLTDDDRRMPVLMKSKVAVGSISVVLQEARPGA
jgi:hypothetical protein